MNNKMILINAPDLDLFGGVSSYYKTLMPLLSNEAVFFCIGSRGGKKIFKKVGRLLSDYISFSQCLWEKKYQLVLLNPSFNFKSIIRDALFLLIAKMTKKKVIVFIHGWDKCYVTRLNEIQFWLFRLVFGQADALIVLAEEFRGFLKKIGINGPIYLETTVVEDSYFYSNQDITLRNPGDHFNILFLSRIEKAKGIYVTLEAYQILKQSFPLVTLTVAGDGGEFEAARCFVLEKGIDDVSFPGYVRGEEKRILYSLADCYILPTTHGEGMPNSILEAMAMGLPVITRPIGGLKDFFEHEKMGFLTESLEPKIYAQYLELLLNDPGLCNKISQYNREYAKKRFAASVVVKRLKSIFLNVCGQS